MKIALRRSNKIGSRIIRLVTGEQWSHIGIEIDGWVFHSDSKGCHIVSASEFSRGSQTLFIDIIDVNFAKDRAIEKLGQPYDFLGILALGTLLMLRKLGISLQFPRINPRWFWCSEYADYILFGEATSLTPEEIVHKYFEVTNHGKNPLL